MEKLLLLASLCLPSSEVMRGQVLGIYPVHNTAVSAEVAAATSFVRWYIPPDA